MQHQASCRLTASFNRISVSVSIDVRLILAVVFIINVRLIWIIVALSIPVFCCISLNSLIDSSNLHYFLSRE